MIYKDHQEEVNELISKLALTSGSAGTPDKTILARAQRETYERLGGMSDEKRRQYIFYHPDVLGQSFDGWTLGFKLSCWRCYILSISDSFAL